MTDDNKTDDLVTEEHKTDNQQQHSVYFSEFDDPTANLVVKSIDGISFRIDDFYLKAGR
jgi:hypothetical protein